jgi:hypothetical protein
MEWDIWDVLVIAVFLANILLMAYTVFVALRLKNGPVANVMGRIKPMVAKGRSIAETGKRELGENKDRLHALTAEVKGIAEAVRPGADGTAPKTQFNYRTLLTIISVLGAVRRGLGQIQHARKPTTNPPGPPKAKKKTPPRRLGIVPEVVRLLLDVRRGLRGVR